ncbi:MAG: GTPase Era [Nitrospira sp.]|nr:GTPase Era [Nitrospira sp.]
MKFGTMAVLGCSNVGKSTLVNTLVNQKIAIVSDKPQTTRSRILGVAHFPQGQLALLDTPGLHRPWHRLNKLMVRTALDAMHDADVLAVMVDGRDLPGPVDRFVVEQIFSRHGQSSALPVFLLVNKIDLIRKRHVLPVIEAYRRLGEWTEIVPISAKTGLNVDRLASLVFDRVVDRDDAFDEDFVTDQSWRHLAAETIREKVIEATKAELPYAVAVKVDEFLEEGRVTTIAATIVVEKPGQKAIVIGKSGERLKAIGTAARLELAKALANKVFLKLHVKVKSAWRDDDRWLVELGYATQP